jgi:fibronectin-binding autotransporter adhesin
MHSMRSFTVLGLACAAVSAPSVRAADRYYVGPDNGSWNNPANWNTAANGTGSSGVPVAGDQVFVPPGVDTAVLLDTSYAAPGLLSLNASGTAGATGTVSQSAGTMTVAEAFTLGNGAGTRGAYTISGGTLALNGDDFVGGLRVGNEGIGTLTVSGATTAVNLIGNANLGVSPGGSGTVNQTNGNVVIGSAAPGGARTLFIGRSATATGVYNLSGPSGLVVNGNINVGFQGNGTVTQDFGVVDVVGGSMFIGNAAGSTGAYNMNLGTLAVDNNIYVGGDASGAGGTGTLTLSGGTTNSGLVVWSTGTVTLNTGANLNVGTTAADNIRNDGVINNNGGTLTLGGRIYGAGTITNASGNVVMDTATILDAATLNIQGGTVTVDAGLALAKSANTTSTLNISGGTTNVTGVLGAGNDGTPAGGAATSTGHVIVSGGALNADTIVLGNTAGGSGDLTVSGTGAVTVGGGLTVNALNVNGGSVTVLDQAPPAGEDAVLDRSIVGGYLRDGTMTVTAGTVTTPKIKLGITDDKTGTYIQSGGTVNVGILAAGNDANINSGQGTGHVTVSGGTLYADTVLLGSTDGGSGDLTVSGTGAVTVGGGLTVNALNVNGGSVTVLDQAPPAGEDPVLDRSIVGGYLRDGDMTVTAGVVTTPRLKVGVTAGKIGTYVQNGGTVTVTDALTAPNGSGSVLAFNGGTLNLKNATIDTAGPVTLGNGTSVFTLNLTGGNASFADGLTVSTSGALTGVGTIAGDVTSAGTIAPGNSPGTIVVTGDLGLQTGADFAFELGSVSDGIAVGDVLQDLSSGGYTFAFSAGPGFANGPYTLITFDSSSGIAPGDFTATGIAGTFAVTPTSLQFTAVPEPAALGVFGVLAAGLLGRRRWRV